MPDHRNDQKLHFRQSIEIAITDGRMCSNMYIRIKSTQRPFVYYDVIRTLACMYADLSDPGVGNRWDLGKSWNPGCSRCQNRQWRGYSLSIQCTATATQGPEPEFVNPQGSPGIDSQAGEPVRQPCLTYQPARLHRLSEWIPWHRFLGSIKV